MDALEHRPTSPDQQRRQPRLVRTLCITALAGAILAWGWFDVRARAIPASGSRGQKTDLIVYLAAAQAAKDGQDIYASKNARNWPYLYPPLPAVLFVPLADLPRGEASYAWFLVSISCFVIGGVVIRQSLRRIDPAGATPATLLAAATIALPMLHTLQRGQINALPLLCVCLAIHALTNRRTFMTGLWLAMAAAIKVTPGLAIGYFVWKWLEHQIRAIRAGTWQTGTLLKKTGAPTGFVVGLALGLLVLPSLYMGRGPALSALTTWHKSVAAGYLSGGADGLPLQDTRGIHDASDRNQSWYRLSLSTVGLCDSTALVGRDELSPIWRDRVRWLLVGTGIVLTGLLAWFSRQRTAGLPPLADMAGLAGFIWLAISMGKIAWGHFYVMIFPLAAVAWLLARRHHGTRDGRAMRGICGLMLLTGLIHYGVVGTNDTTRTREIKAGERIILRAKGAGPGDLGGLLLPAGVLAVAAMILAGRELDQSDCRERIRTSHNQ